MRLIVLALMLLAFTPCLAGKLEDLDNKNGFRDLKFGTQLELIDGLRLVEESKSGIKWYSRKSTG